MKINVDKLVRKNIRELTPYSSARDEFEGSDGVFLDANENPFGTINRYPDPYQKALKVEISKLKDVPVENIFPGNGSDEIIDLAYRIFCEPGKDKACIFTPTYGMYKVSADINNVGLIEIPLKEDFQIPVDAFLEMSVKQNIKLVFICTPNNPTGNAIKKADIEKLAQEFKGIVVIDEAYIDFCGSGSNLPLIKKYNNVLVMQTFSKAWGMAGARVGMAFAGYEILNYFNRVKPPYNVSTLNQQAMLEKLKNNNAYQQEVSLILSEKKKLISELGGMKIVEKIFPSDANFLLARFKDAKTIYRKLVKEGIIVRDRTSAVESCLRITIGTPDENQKLIETLKQIEI
jgi:histidinol-phosphate aminotransferase